MGNCNQVMTPLEARLKFSKEGDARQVNSTEFRSIIGSLRYLTHTRPDLAYSVGLLSRNMERPTSEHMASAKRIMRYIKGTLNSGLVYLKHQQDGRLVGYSDSDYAGDALDRKSTSGHVYFLGSSIVS